MGKQFAHIMYAGIWPAYFVSFFLPMHLQTWLFLPCSIAIVYQGRNQIRKLSGNNLMYALLMGAMVWFYVLWLPFTAPDDRDYLLFFLERKAGLVFLPLLMLFIRQSSLPDWRELLPWFVYGAVLMICVFNGIILFKSMSDNTLLSQHVAYRTAFESVTALHPSYAGIYVVFALSILWFESAAFHRLPWGLFRLMEVVLFCGLFMLMPKAAILALLAVLLLRFRVALVQLSRYNILLVILSMLLIVLLLYFGVPVVHQRVDEVWAATLNGNAVLTDNSVALRWHLFKINLALLHEHWLLGLGPVELQHQLDMRMFYTSVYTGKALGTYNTHCEYLNQWLSFGISGMLLFVTILSLHIRRMWQRKDALYAAFLILILLSFATENVLSRQHGILFFGLFSSLFFFDSRQRPETTGEKK